MSAGRSSGRFVPQVEGLEDRTVPSGNVRVAIIGGTLVVRGDDAGNQITVTGVGKNAVAIRSLDGTTTINGGTGFYGSGIRRGYDIRLGGGDDVLIVTNTRANAPLNIDTGAGNDYVGISGAGHGKETAIRTGDGNDVVVLHMSIFRQWVFVDTGAGNDTVITDHVGAANFGVENPSGTDFFDPHASNLGRPSIIGFLPGTPPPTDTVAPTVTLTTAAPATFNTSPITFTATFSKDVFGFSAAGVAVTNGSVTAFTQVDAHTYTFSVTPAGQGVVSATVSAGAATDAAGNANLASDTVSRTFDSVTAAPTFDLAPASDSGAVGDLRTDKATVDLVGAAEPGATVTLFRATSGTAPGSGAVVAQTTATAGGTFTFSGVALALGPNSFATRATDALGNVSTTVAQTFTRNSPPTVATPIPDQTLTVADGAQTFALDSVFADAETVVRLTVAFPTGQTDFIDVNLFDASAPATVANFMSRVTGSAYNGTIFHRLVQGFVLQGGGFTFDPNGTDTATTFPPTAGGSIANEPSVSNTRGTLAMAKAGSPPSSANEFFFNLGDNSSNLDTQTGGFTVFGQVMNGGLHVVDQIAQMNTFSGPGLPGAPPFPVGPNADTSNFPLNLTAADLAIVTSAGVLPAALRMNFAVVGVDSNPVDPAAGAVVTATVSGSTLTITPQTAGTATITLRATDLDGSSVTTTVKVTVT